MRVIDTMSSSELIQGIRKVAPRQKQNIYIGRIISASPLLMSVAGIQVDDEDIYRPPDLELSKDDEVAVAFIEKDDDQDFIVLNKIAKG